MKKQFSYILIGCLVLAILVLFITGTVKPNRRLDERITLQVKDKIPYGGFVAYNELKYIFPNATVYINSREPGYWDSLSNYESGQAFISVAPRFSADQEEMRRLIKFVENGNDVFISAQSISSDALDMMNCTVNDGTIISLFGDDEKVTKPTEDSFRVSLSKPPFSDARTFVYPGLKFDASFTTIDSSTTDVLGTSENNLPDFIRLHAGKGNFYVQLAPLVFSNYFLLHKQNISYYEKALSVINPHVTRVVWDEYYLHKKYYNERRQPRENWLNVLFRYPALKAALLTALFTLLIFVLLGMRRKQRYIPVITKPKNESLDFVRTIGRLYYDKGDHKNLCRKMASYFLEHVRNRYKLPTGKLDDEFIINLQFKTGYVESGIRGIVSFIKYIDDAPSISQHELSDFHKQLELFYTQT